MKKILFFVLPMLIVALYVSAFSEQPRAECEICGMWIDQYMGTRHVITLKDGTLKSFCSLVCTAKYLKKHKGDVKKIEVADFLTEKLVCADNAFYLEESDIPAVMSYISRVAFAEKSDAEKFQKEHGGRVITFNEALKNQLPGSGAEKKPIEVKSRDKCPVCGMFVAKYPKWVAQIIFKDSSYDVFDGAKDMFKYYHNMSKYNPSKKKSDIIAIYVTEYYSTKLMGAGKVYFIKGSNVYGPMGKELIPIAKEGWAKEFLKDHKGERILRFNEVKVEDLK